MVDFTTKPQKLDDMFNYFPNEEINITLHKVKVSWIDFKTRSISFVINDVDSMEYIKKINNDIYSYLSPIDFSHLNKMYFEKNSNMYIKCKSSPNTQFVFEHQVENFKFPCKGYIYDTVHLRVKNVWSIKKNYGINLELVMVQKN